MSADDQPADDISRFEASHAALDELISTEYRLQALNSLRRYFYTTAYAGRRFERLDGGGDRDGVANVITAADLAALPLLSIRITRPGLVIDLLETHRAAISTLLSEIPQSADIRTVDAAALEVDSPAAALYWLLRGCEGVGATTASKLLARKRPRLFPIDDVRVRQRLGRNTDLWQCWRTWLLLPGRSRAVEQLRADAGDIDDISLLRVMDVVAWMDGERQQGSLQEGGSS